MVDPAPTLADLALEAISLGYSVVPPRPDATKRPMGEWKRYQHERPTETDIRRWYAAGNTGLGLVCGAVSGGLEMLEFEGRAVAEGLHEVFADRAAERGLTDLVDRIYFGYSEWTPSGGMHLLYRCDQVDGNLKLARRPSTPDELEQQPDAHLQVLIETRGEGGYTIVAPSHGAVHPSGGRWEIIEGSLATVARITPDERRQLLDLARSLDRMPVAGVTALHAPTTLAQRPQMASSDERPGDAYNNAPDAAWRTLALLQEHGWQVHHEHGDEIHLTRPGKDPREGASAVLHLDGGTLVVFSSSTTFPTVDERGLSPFAVYAHLEHAGDLSAAARALRASNRPPGPSTSTTRNLDSNDTLPPPPEPPDDIYDQDAPWDYDPTPPDPNELQPDDIRPFERVDLAALMAGGIPEPDILAGWIYAGRLTALQSEPGVGKTWLALWLALKVMDGGRNVIYLDEEGGPELATERLLALGADPDLVAERFWYCPYPTRSWDLADQAAFHQLIEDAAPAGLAVFDSLPDFLAMAGKSEDSAQEVTWWINRVCGICRHHGVAQIVLDHLVKPEADKQRRTQSRYARGSGAKLAKVDATLLIETGTEFDAAHSGQLKVWKTKDRRGRLHIPSLGKPALPIDVRVRDNTVAFHVLEPAAETVSNSRTFRPTHLMERISQVIEGLNEAGVKASTNAILRDVKGKQAHKIEALGALVDEGYITREAGPRNAVWHVVAKPYREYADVRSDKFMHPQDEPPEEDF